MTAVADTPSEPVFELHPSLVLEPDDRNVFGAPELTEHIPVSRALHSGQRLC